jgi:type II secretory pathway pseudopilin PulG
MALRHRCQQQGFALPELLLAFGLGVSLTGLMLQIVLSEGQSGQRLARLLRERAVVQRGLDLLRADLQRASSLAADAGVSGQAAACGLSRRTVVLHLQTPEGPITYSVGRPAEPIWRGQVLMRCGTVFGLDGTPSSGKALNRVLFDGLPTSGGVKVSRQGLGGLLLQVRQELNQGGRPSQVVEHQRLLPVPIVN